MALWPSLPVALALSALPSARAALRDAQTGPPRLMLANPWRAGLDLHAYWVSEKFDGVRGYWDGSQLWTRGGGRVMAPAWFTRGWPPQPMDGELWAGHGRFETAQSTVALTVPDHAAWQRMHYMVFDLPSDPAPFSRRKDTLASAVQAADVAWLRAVDHAKVDGAAALQARLRSVVADGGEGLMLHRGDSAYRGRRSDDLLKLKLYDDAEARVVGLVPGKGKHLGVMGALWVETGAGLRFRLGSGFTDAQRRAPPAIGSVVTYRYRGINPTGIPRFATFLRVQML